MGNIIEFICGINGCNNERSLLIVASKTISFSAETGSESDQTTLQNESNPFSSPPRQCATFPFETMSSGLTENFAPVGQNEIDKSESKVVQTNGVTLVESKSGSDESGNESGDIAGYRTFC